MNFRISGMMLSIFGCTVVILHDSIVLINVLPLDNIRVSLIIGGVVGLIGCILLLVEDYVKGDPI